MSHFSSVAIAALGLASLVPAQILAEGLQSAVQPLAGSVRAALVHPLGVVTFDGQDVVLTPAASPPQVLLHLPAPVFAAFLIDAGNDRVLLAEGSTHAVWLVPLQAPPPAAPLATIPFAYDAVLYQPDWVWVSAKVQGLGSPDNQILWLNLATGALTTAANVPGASGPLEVDAQRGDVLYATASNAFPPPPGSCSVLRVPQWVIAQVPPPFGAGHLQLVRGGLDAASDLALDDDDDLHFVDWRNNRIGELSQIGWPSPWLGEPTVDYTLAPYGAVTLQYVRAAGAPGLEPFQHASGVLQVFESDFFAASRLRAVRSAPAALAVAPASPVPAGPVALALTGGPANGLGVLAFAAAPPGPASVLPLPAFEQLVAWNSVLMAPPVTVVLALDAAGAASFAFTNPGFASPLAATAQAFFLSPAGVAGSTPHLAPSFTQ